MIYQVAWTSIENIDYYKLTHINYSFSQPNADGTLKALPNPEKLKTIVKLSHEKNVKLVNTFETFHVHNTPEDLSEMTRLQSP